MAERFRVPLLKSCCCCLSLQIGTITIGILCLLGSGEVLVEQLGKKRKILGTSSFEQEALQIAADIASFLTVMVVVTIMIFGAAKKNMMMMLPWIVIWATGLMATLIFAVMMIFMIPLLAAVLFVILAVVGYMWLVVFSFFKEVELEMMNQELGKLESIP